MKIHSDLGIAQPTEWFLQRPREAMMPMAEPDHMEGPAEADEACIGGREKNKHSGKKGRAKKAAVVGVRDRKTGQAAAGPVPETAAARLCHFVESHIESDTMAYTDKSKAYSNPRHGETVNHGDGEYVRGDVHTNGILPRSSRIESFRAILRRGYYGTFHRIRPKHLHRYVNEFAGRLNNRFRDTMDMMGALVRGMSVGRLTHAWLIR